MRDKTIYTLQEVGIQQIEQTIDRLRAMIQRRRPQWDDENLQDVEEMKGLTIATLYLSAYLENEERKQKDDSECRQDRKQCV